jgi:photosystem II stability/assembly factor-like uncharacterized protein
MFASGRDAVIGAVTFDESATSGPSVGFIVSQDGGATFERRQTIDPPGVVALWRDPSGAVVAAGEAGVVLVSLDEGRSWRERTAHPQGTATFHGLWTDGRREVWVGGDACVLVHSRDGGQSFERVADACPPGRSDTLRSLWSGRPDDVYVAGAVIRHTTDGGKHFTDATPPTRGWSGNWKVWGSGVDDVYASGCGVWRSADAARSWRRIDPGGETGRCEVASILIGVGRKELLAATGPSLLHSADGGDTWSERMSPGTDFRIAGGPGGLYAFGPAGRLLRSRDVGRSWHALDAPLGSHASVAEMGTCGQALCFLAAGFEERDGHVVVVRSDDGGSTWRSGVRVPAGARALGLVRGHELLVAGWRGAIFRVP